MQPIDAIILAGGVGKRLKTVVSDVPKPLAAVGGKPFLDILLGRLNESHCINRVVLAVGYKAEKIIAEYENRSDYNFQIAFSMEDTLLGTGGGIRKALGYTTTEDVLAMNGDSYTQVDITDLLKSHRTNNAKLTIVLVSVEDAGRYGSVGVDMAELPALKKRAGRANPA
jgi:D-glycero-alpha-D-manno-heptose 1-phosphate guanylyltransferase